MARVSPDARVPAELWSRVLSLANQDDHPSFMLALATVCKSWTEPAITTLYRSIKLWSVDQSLLLAHTLESSQCKRGPLIQNLVFALTEPPDSVIAATWWMTCSHRILLQASQLRYFESQDNAEATGSHVASISAVAHSTLRDLRLVIKGGQSYTILTNIHTFSGLRYLNLDFFREIPLARKILDSISPVTMPSVRMLRLILTTDDLGELDNWLFRCRFPRVAKIMIALPRFDEASGAELIAFFRAHGATCQDLSIGNTIFSGETQAFNEALYAVLRNTAPRLSFVRFVPKPFLFKSWAPGTKMAQLTLNVHPEDFAAESMSALMDELGRHDYRPAGLKLVAAITDDRFTWDCGARSKAHAECVGKLMHYALLLAPKGVSIEDQDRRVIIPGAT